MVRIGIGQAVMEELMKINDGWMEDGCQKLTGPFRSGLLKSSGNLSDFSEKPLVFLQSFWRIYSVKIGLAVPEMNKCRH